MKALLLNISAMGIMYCGLYHVCGATTAQRAQTVTNTETATLTTTIPKHVGINCFWPRRSLVRRNEPHEPENVAHGQRGRIGCKNRFQNESQQSELKVRTNSSDKAACSCSRKDPKAKARASKHPCLCPSPASNLRLLTSPGERRNRTLLSAWGLRLTHIKHCRSHFGSSSGPQHHACRNL